MKIEPYLFATGERTGAGLIIQTSFPYYLGKVWTFRTQDEYAEFMANRCPEIGSKINDYRVLIEGIGSLERSNSNPSAIARIYREMADFYLKFKIQPNHGYYKRFKEV